MYEAEHDCRTHCRSAAAGRKRGRLGVLALAAGLALAGMGAQVGAQTMKIGALFPFSGSFAAFGQDCYRGLELAVEERNARGGVRGTRIELVKADATDTSQAVSEARRLVTVVKAQAVFGTYASSLSYAATQVTELAGVPYFELTGTADDITGRGYKYVYRYSPNASYVADGTMVALEKIVAPGLGVDPKDMKIAFVHEDGIYGATVVKRQQAIAKEKGYQVVNVLPYSAKSVDMSAIVLKLKAAGAEVIMPTSYESDTILLMRQLDAAKYAPKAIIGTGGGWSLETTAKALGGRLDGTFSADFPSTAMNEAGAPGLKDFLEKYQARYGSLPSSSYGLVAYVGAHQSFDALEKAKSMDKDDIREAVLALDVAVGGTAVGWGVKFGQDGQNTRAFPAVLQWQNGKRLTVYPKDAAIAEPVFAN